MCSGITPSDKPVAWPLAPLDVFAGLEIGHLLARGEHELLVRLDFPRQLRHLLDELAQVTRQRMLGQQFGEVLGGGFQPIGGGTQPGVMGEMADGLVWQVMAFVEHVDRVARIRQHRTAAQGQVGQDHVVVGDDDVDLAHAFAGLVEGALAEVRAVAVGALAMVGGQAGPVGVFQGGGPTVAVAVPFIAGQLLDHAGEQLLAGFIHLDLEAFFFEQLGRGGLGMAFLEQHVELGQAHVAPAAFGQCEREAQPAVAHQVGQVLVDDLLLQGDGGRGDHQALAGGLGGGNRRQAVGHGLAGTGAGLHRHDGRLAAAPTFVVGVDVTQDFCHFGNHQALAISRLEALGFEKTRIGALDRGFEFGADHEWSGAKNAG